MENKRRPLDVTGSALMFAFLLTLVAAPLKAQTVEYIHTDALGTPVAITDTNKIVVQRSEYEPYGALLNRPMTDGPGYTGHVMDSATGLAYMQQRYYDPQIGRFLSMDPVAADGNTGGNFNRYWYANNNPYTVTDPDGRLALDKKEQPTQPLPGPTPLPPVIVTAPPPPPVQNMAAVTVIAPRIEPMGRPIPFPVWISATAGALISAPFLYLYSPHPCGGIRCGELTHLSNTLPPGYWAGDKGAEEWGRRNNAGAKEGRGRFHGIKQSEKGQGGGRGTENYGVNPDTGDVVNPAGEVIGNLSDVKSK